MSKHIEGISKSDIEDMNRDELFSLRNRFLQLNEKWFADPAWPNCTEDTFLSKYRLLVDEMKKRKLMYVVKEIDRALFGKVAREISEGESVDISKPYPNFHSCHLKDPDDFEDGTIRTTYREHDGKKYSVLSGKLEGETSMTEQAFRYHKDTWDIDDARSHCKDHDGKFEKAKDVEKQEISQVVKFVGLKKAEPDEEDTDERIVMGVVYEPDKEDTQGDWASAEEIRKAAYTFMESNQIYKVNHEGSGAMIHILESYLAPVDFEIEGETVKKGSWLMASRVVDDEIWKQIKDGEITGYSMAGGGLRIVEPD